ncbi:MAG TPA: PQQ-binding-like beta-propeller repeat protein [Planctomycetota bacterium]
MIFALALALQDWPQWRGPGRDGVTAEKNLLQEWPEGGPPVRWKVDGLGKGWSSPVIGGGRLYVTGDVGDDLLVRAFDLEGKPLWTSKNGAAWTASYPGARASCAFSEGKLYLLNAHGRLAAFDAASGKELWARDVMGDFEASNITWALSEGVLIDGPRVIVTPGGRKALMAALDKADGKTVWTTEPLDATGYASPVLVNHEGRRLILQCSSGHAFGVDADTGKRLWAVPLKNQYGTNISAPVYGGGRVHVAAAFTTGACYALGPDGPAAVWPTPLDTSTGYGLLVDGLLYGGGYQKVKGWIAVDWKSGETKHAQRDLAPGGAVWGDGRLHVMAEDGRAALLTPDLKIAGQFRYTAKKVNDAWAHPVLLDGRLYLRYHDTLTCFNVSR